MILAAATVFGFAACTVNELSPIETPVRTLRTFTCGFDEETKTSINRQGKTLWSEGDKILLTNGTESDTVIVDALYAGEKYCEFTTALEGTLYAVYPYNVCDSVTTEGKIIVNVPSTQDGTFGSANIACAVADDAARKISLRNVTSVLKFKVPAITDAPVVFASVNANENSLSGPVSVSFAGGEPVVEAVENGTYFSNVSVQVGGFAGDFYLSVIPGTYSAGFYLTAATLDLQHASETKATVSDKELKANDLFDLGKIGEDLKPMGGDGSAENPYQITTIGEMIVLASYVNEGNSLKEKHVKLMNNIEGVSLPIGIYDEKNNNFKYFQGEFDGNGNTITLAMNKRDGRALGLFGALKDSAYVHDLNLTGSVVSNSERVGALAGNVWSATELTVRNVSSSAYVEGLNYVGGIFGYIHAEAANATDITKCVNNGSVYGLGRCAGGIAGVVYSKSNAIYELCSNNGPIRANQCAAGIVGYSYMATYQNCINNGIVETVASNGGVSSPTAAGSNNGTGGIIGFAQNTYIKNCTNNGALQAVDKVGGISGVLYWGYVHNSKNTASIHSENGECGGIIAWGHTNAQLKYCENAGSIVAAKGYCIGGIAGRMVTVKRDSNSPCNVQMAYCVNKGGVKGCNTGIGGICGYAVSTNNGTNGITANRVETYYCTNEGDVTSTASRAAGIIGHLNDTGSYTMSHITGCINKGKITGTTQISGILGVFENKYKNGRVDIRNCENDGIVLSISEAGVLNIGGIFGGQTNANTGQGVYIENCLNNGDILYSNVQNKNPRAGGIAGSHYGPIKNCYSGGKIGPVEGEIPADATAIGGIVGFEGNQSSTYCYYLDGSAPQAFGKGSKSYNIANFLSAGADGLFLKKDDGTEATSVTINNVEYADVVSALNAYGDFGYKWTTGPKFSFTGNVGIGDDLDLGNGGNL